MTQVTQNTPTATAASLPSQPKTRAQVMRLLQERIPCTQEGFPVGFLRPDLVSPNDELPPNNSLPADSFVELSYTEGFPTLPDGRPFWHKWDQEGPIEFAAFELYVQLGELGPRNLSMLLGSAELQAITAATSTSLTSEYLAELATMYAWRDRARAFDLFQEAAYRHIRTRRAQTTEDTAYIRASAMLTKAMAAADKPEFWKNLEHDPKLFLEFFEKLTKIQRVAAGLPAAAPIESQQSNSTATDFEMIVRQVKEASGVNQGANGTTLDASGRVVPSNSSFMRNALHDPDSARQLQEVIIRMSQRGGATKRPRWMSRNQRQEEQDDSDDSGSGTCGATGEPEDIEPIAGEDIDITRL